MSAVPEVDPLLTRTVTDVLRDACPPAGVRDHEGRWFAAPWDALTQAGLTGIGVPEEAGGSGGTAADAAMVLRLVGRFAAPVPLAEHALLGGWLLASIGQTLPAAQPVTVAPGDRRDSFGVSPEGSGWRARGELRRVPWAEPAAFVLAIVDGTDGEMVVRLDPATATITAGDNLAGERRDSLTFDTVLGATDVVAAPPGISREALRQRGALTRVLLAAGALDAVLEIATRHTSDRRQFGQPLNKFQAVAQRLALLGEEVARGQVAADITTVALTGSVLDSTDVAVAKVTAGEAASVVARHAHQVTGAIGVSQEFDLPLFTRRLFSWRDEYGNESGWARSLGTQIAANGADALWEWVSA
jgi:acyl-CoA dehydrogenase